MRTTRLACLLAGSLASVVAAQDAQRPQSVDARIDALQKEIDALKRDRGLPPGNATGSASEWAPTRVSSEYTRARRYGLPLPQDGVTSSENESVKISGRLDFEFYDANANRASRGVYDGNQFGMSRGASEFRVRRLQLGFGMELIEDFVFKSTLTLDPVVRDEDEGAADIDEAYVRFNNVIRNLFGFEDPTHLFLQLGNYYRWERDFLNRWSESFSLAGTAFYRDEVTGIQIGGDLEAGFFWRVSIDNGSRLTARDAGVGANRGLGNPSVATGNSPVFHDNEQLGDLNNSKDVSVGVGFQNEVEEPNLTYGLGIVYRHGRLSGPERTLLAGTSGAYDGTSRKDRLGILFATELDLDTVSVGANAELWFAQDGNGDRKAWAVGPYLKVPLDGVYYQQRLFFTGIGAGYRLSGLHLSDGFTNTNPAVANSHILDDRTMHTIAFWIDVTRNVDMRFELNNIDPSNGQTGSETEWLLQWSISF